MKTSKDERMDGILNFRTYKPYSTTIITNVFNIPICQTFFKNPTYFNNVLKITKIIFRLSICSLNVVTHDDN